MKRQIARARARTGLVAMLLLVGVDGVAAQRPGGRRPPPGARGQRVRMEQMIQARFDGLVRDQLELSGEQGRQLSDIVEDFRQRRQELAVRERQVQSTVLRLGTRAAEDRDLSDEEASDALEEMVGLREEEARLFREEQEALVDVLTPQQLLRFVVMRRQLAERIQRIRSGGGPPGGPPGGPGGRPRGGRRPGEIRPER